MALTLAELGEFINWVAIAQTAVRAERAWRKGDQDPAREGLAKIEFDTANTALDLLAAKAASASIVNPFAHKTWESLVVEQVAKYVGIQDEAGGDIAPWASPLLVSAAVLDQFGQNIPSGVPAGFVRWSTTRPDIATVAVSPVDNHLARMTAVAAGEFQVRTEILSGLHFGALFRVNADLTFDRM